MESFFYRSELCTHEHKSHHSEPENYSLTLCTQIMLIYGTVLRYDNQICVEKLPLAKIWKNKPKIEIPLSKLLIIRDIQNSPLDICFGG